MRELPASECAILPLVLKKKWYDLIDSGEKTEEYRDAKPFWEKRIKKWLNCQRDHLDISNKYLIIGFSRDCHKPDMFFMARFCEKRDVSLMPAWGEPQGTHYALGLGERVKIGE